MIAHGSIHFLLCKMLRRGSAQDLRQILEVEAPWPELVEGSPRAGELAWVSRWLLCVLTPLALSAPLCGVYRRVVLSVPPPATS